MTYAILDDFQGAFYGEPRAYAGRVYSLHGSRDSAFAALDSALKVCEWLPLRDRSPRVAVVHLTGTLKEIGTELQHRQIIVISIAPNAEHE